MARAGEFERIARLVGIASTVVAADRSVEVDWVTGASVMFRTDALREVGLFDDGFFLYFEEVELMHRLQAVGWTVRHVPSSKVLHVEGASTGLNASGRTQPLPDYWYRSRARYFALTGGRRATVAASLGWLAGRAVAVIKAALGRRTETPIETAKIFRGFWPSQSDLRASVASYGDKPGRPPFWIVRS